MENVSTNCTYQKGDYRYHGYLVKENGDIYTPRGKKVKWNKDGVHVKLNLDGNVRNLNGLKILYTLYHELDEVPSSKYIVEYIVEGKGRGKENLTLSERDYSLKVKHKLNEDDIEEIKVKYGLDKVGTKNEEKRSEIKSQYEHPSVSYRSLAEEYGVSLFTIEAIIRGTYGKKRIKATTN